MQNQTARNTQQDFKLNALKEAGISYSLSAILPVLLTLVFAIVLAIIGGNHEQEPWYLYCSYLLPQIGFAVTAVIYFKRSKVSLKATYCGCKWYYFLLMALMQFGLLFSLNGLNGYFVQLLELLGYKQQMTLPPLDGWNLLPAILVIALLPALFEETLMRGILARQMYESGWGLGVSVAISGALFSLFHHNPEQTLYQFCCGMCYTLIALRSGSVFPTIAAHFCNNALVLTLQSVYAPVHGENWAFTDVMPVGGYIALLVFSALCLIGSLVYLIAFDKRNVQKDGVKHGKLFLLAAAVGILTFAVEWVVYLIAGFMPNG